jgi:23S rRNA (pseudouridine1915-N3)-methyltransferase
MPAWVSNGYQEYARRMPPECRLELTEIRPGKRSAKADVARILDEEGKRMLAALPSGCRVIALEVDGKSWDTTRLAQRLGEWLQAGQDIALLVGGPEGLSPACRERAELCWSLSPLTFPHPLVRVVLAEQLYRAWTLLSAHPYHRS